MRERDIAATCVPVQFDDGGWESAFFFHVSGPESRQDRRILKKNKLTPTVLHTELMKHEGASVVALRVEASTVFDDPLVFEILLVPGQVSMHYECLKLLARQDRIRYFFADSDYRVIQEQQHGIGEGLHEEFETVAREAFAHDSVLRIAGKYDSRSAVSEIVAHYQVRSEPAGNPDGTSH